MFLYYVYVCYSELPSMHDKQYTPWDSREHAHAHTHTHIHTPACTQEGTDKAQTAKKLKEIKITKTLNILVHVKGR